MNKNDVQKAEQLSVFLGDLLVQISQDALKEPDAAGKFRALGLGLQDLAVQAEKMDGSAGFGIVNRISAASTGAGRTLALIDGESDAALRVSHIAAMIHELETISDALLDACNSAVCPPAEPSARQQERIAAVKGLVRKGGEVAFDFHLATETLRFSIGLKTPESRQNFRFPHPGHCGCEGGGSSAVGHGHSPKPVLTAAQLATVTIDEEAYSAQMAAMNALSKSLADYTGEAGGVFRLPMLLGMCPNLCAPAGGLISCVFGAVTTFDDGFNWIPEFTVIWTICCTCTCCVLWTQDKAQTVTTTHRVTGIVIPNTRQKAVADTRAAKLGNTEVNNFNASLPPGPPPPPPFVPNPAIVPPLTQPACVAC